MAMASNLSTYSWMSLSTSQNLISGEQELHGLHLRDPWHGVCSSGRGLFWWGILFVWKLNIFPGTFI